MSAQMFVGMAVAGMGTWMLFNDDVPPWLRGAGFILACLGVVIISAL